MENRNVGTFVFRLMQGSADLTVLKDMPTDQLDKLNTVVFQKMCYDIDITCKPITETYQLQMSEYLKALPRESAKSFLKMFRQNDKVNLGIRIFEPAYDYICELSGMSGRKIKHIVDPNLRLVTPIDYDTARKIEITLP